MKTENILIIGAFLLMSSSSFAQKEKKTHETVDSELLSKEKTIEYYIDYDKEFDILSSNQEERLIELSKTDQSQGLNEFKGNCSPLDLKRGFKLDLGELVVNFKLDKPTTIKGLSISKEGVNAVLEAVIALDLITRNVCLIIDKLPAPQTDEERQFILNLFKEQRNYYALFSKMKTLIALARSEKEIIESMKQFEEDLKQFNK